MKKTGKILLGIASLWPITYMVIFFSFFIFNFLRIMSGSTTGNHGNLPSWTILIFILHMVTMLWIFVLLVIYIIDVFKNDKVDKDKKALWAIVLSAYGFSSATLLSAKLAFGIMLPSNKCAERWAGL